MRQAKSGESAILFRVNLWMERSAIANMAKDIVLFFSVYGVIFFGGDLLHLIWASLFAILSILVSFGDLRNRLGHEAFEYAREQFSWENTARHFLTLYHRILENKN